MTKDEAKAAVIKATLDFVKKVGTELRAFADAYEKDLKRLDPFLKELTPHERRGMDAEVNSILNELDNLK